jgi:type IV pilus assembly protein PilW
LASLDPNEWYRMDSNTASLNRRRRAAGGCANFAPMRQYFTRIYYIANNLQAGDGIPTLMRVDLGANSGGAVAFSDPIPISSGIEDLQFEYGIDVSGDGMPDIAPDGFTSNPDTFARTGGPYADCAANPDCTRNWRDVMAVKIFLLARNSQAIPGHTDGKTYGMGSGVSVGPFNDGFKRHAYQTVVRLNNPAGRREQ